MTKEHVIAASFAMEAYRIRSSGMEFWNEAAADHAYAEAVKIGAAFEAARDRALKREQEEKGG